MSGAGSGIAVEARLALAEKAICDLNERVAELSTALIAAVGDRRDERRLAHEEIVIGADAISPFSEGFHACERDTADRPYRWAGRGDSFEIRFRADRDIEWAFDADIRGNSHVDIKLLRAFVDYMEVPIEFAKGHRVSGPIPRRPFSDRVTLTFYLPKHFVPAQSEPSSTDTRTLSAVFYELRANPATAQQSKGKLHSVAKGLAHDLASFALSAKVRGVSGTGVSPGRANLD